MILFKIQHPAGWVKSFSFAAGMSIFTHVAFGQATIPASLTSALAQNIPQTVIVLFDGESVQTAAQATANTQGVAISASNIMVQMRTGYATLKANAIRGLSARISQKIDYPNLPMTAFNVPDSNALAELVARPSVIAVYANIRHQKVLAESLPLIKANTAHAVGKKGAGTTVAVLDSGVDYKLPAFGSCSAPNVPTSCRVVFAKDFAPEDGMRDDSIQHGTNVSGVVAGVAPAAKIAGLDVFDNEDAYPTDIISAIDWVIANKQQYNIVAMNLSLGEKKSKYATDCLNSWATAPFARARSVGILPVVAAGNDGFSNGISSPACTPGAVRVGAVYDFTGSSFTFPEICADASVVPDKIACFSNSAKDMVTFLAPGSQVTAAGIPMSGTSQATPFAAAAIAVLRAADAFAADSLEQTLTRLVASGKFITDVRNGVAVPRIDLGAAVTNPLITVLLQQGAGGIGGAWILSTDYKPLLWKMITPPLGSNWVLRAIDSGIDGDRVLLQQGDGGIIGIWDLGPDFTPKKWWFVNAAVPGWIARDLEENRILLQHGDGGMTGMWYLNNDNKPAVWKSLYEAIPGWIVRSLNGNRILVQYRTGNLLGYWILDAQDNVTDWKPINNQPTTGLVLRSLRERYALIQAGDGGMAGIWYLDTNDMPLSWHTIISSIPGWVLRGIGIK